MHAAVRDRVAPDVVDLLDPGAGLASAIELALGIVKAEATLGGFLEDAVAVRVPHHLGVVELLALQVFGGRDGLVGSTRADICARYPRKRETDPAGQAQGTRGEDQGDGRGANENQIAAPDA